MRKNVTQLVAENAKLGNPVNISIRLRTDRPLHEVMWDADFQPILKYNPAIDFTWSFTSAGGRITQELLPLTLKLRKAPAKREPCVSLYNGLIILPDGTALACSCVAAMDAVADLCIGNIREQSLLEIYAGDLMRQIRNQFRAGGGTMNHTCANCEMYRDLGLYRTREGRMSRT